MACSIESTVMITTVLSVSTLIFEAHQRCPVEILVIDHYKFTGSAGFMFRKVIDKMRLNCSDLRIPNRGKSFSVTLRLPDEKTNTLNNNSL